MKKDTLTAAEFRIAVRNIKRDFADDVEGANRVIANMTDVWDVVPDPDDPDLIPPKPTPKVVVPKVVTSYEPQKEVTIVDKKEVPLDEERVRAIALSRNPYTRIDQVSEYEWQKARDLVRVMQLEPNATRSVFPEDMPLADMKKAVLDQMAEIATASMSDRAPATAPGTGSKLIDGFFTEKS